MADEQPPHSDLIDDAIRQAERQLEQKLDALRMSALGESAPASATLAEQVPHIEHVREEIGYGAEADFGGETGYGDTGRDDSSFGTSDDSPWKSTTPVSRTVDPEWEPVEEPGRDQWQDAVMRPVEAPRAVETPHAAATVTGHEWSGAGFVPDDEAGGEVAQLPPRDDSSLRSFGEMPVVANTPSEEEVQFWAQTRTALRLLQQSTEDLQHDVVAKVTDQVEQIVRDELSTPNAALRQLQQQLPTVAERFEQSLVDELEGPSSSIRQMQEELPVQLERLERQLGGALQEDIARFEHSVADNVTRMAQGVSDDVDRVERSMRTEFERIESTVRSELNRVGENVRGELELPAAGVRHIQDELPLQFQHIERVMRDELVPTRRGVRDLVELDLGNLLGELINAGRLSLDKLGSFSGELERNRVQHAEDLELVVDTISAGFQGMGKAMMKVLDRLDEVDQRVGQVDERLVVLAQIDERLATLTRHNESAERAVAGISTQLEHQLDDIRVQIQELRPAPVVVTINHPDAQVEQSTRGGFNSRQEVEG